MRPAARAAGTLCVVNVRIRPFEDRDYDRHAEISSAIEPTTAYSADMLRHRDATREERVRLVCLAAELEPHGVAGVGRLTNIWWSYHPRHYQMRIDVEPRWQRRGIGAALFESLLNELQAWDAELVRAETRGDRSTAISFLEHRGFREWRRRWESVLTVASANVTSLLNGQQRMRDAGVTITTYASELAKRGERLAHDLYEMEVLISRDEPGTEPGTEPMSFGRFVGAELNTPDALPEAHFLAMLGERLVGVSRLTGDLNHGDVLRQAFTGTRPEFRGRGIAQALKLRTIEFARERGLREIRTSNDSTNEPMLHINGAIGFQRESPVIIFERRLDATPTAN
jgi:GNAT superfamily N-acetyltransferase